MTKLIALMSVLINPRGRRVKVIRGYTLLGYISSITPVIKPTNFLMNSLIISPHVYITTPILNL